MGRPKDGSLNILRWGMAGSKIYEKPAQCSSRIHARQNSNFTEKSTLI